MKSITEAQELLRTSVSLKNKFLSDNIKDIEIELEKNMKNLDNNVRLRKDLEQSVNQLWKILEKKWKPTKVTTSSTTVVSCNSFKTKEKRQGQKSGRRKTNNDGRGEVEQSFKLIFFGIVSLN